ncbi:MAG: hypothetical protein HC787_02880 [Nostocaceae cyanobacterium CSU_2_110]|nr:hypothetical protein [Nostocaceae cyanobacterium CSU_2_110]
MSKNYEGSMARQCKTCTSTLRDEIDLQIMQGASFAYIERWCSDRGLIISVTALRKHAVNHIKGYKEKMVSEVKECPKVDTIANQLPDPTIVDFEAYLKKIELDIKESIETKDCAQQLKALQMSVVENYFRLSAILNQKLIEYAEGKTKFPMEQVKAVSLFFDVYCKSTGLNLYIDHNLALDIVNKFYGQPTIFRDSNNILHVREENSQKTITINLEEKTVDIE